MIYMCHHRKKVKVITEADEKTKGKDRDGTYEVRAKMLETDCRSETCSYGGGENENTDAGERVVPSTGKPPISSFTHRYGDEAVEQHRRRRRRRSMQKK